MIIEFEIKDITNISMEVLPNKKSRFPENEDVCILKITAFNNENRFIYLSNDIVDYKDKDTGYYKKYTKDVNKPKSTNQIELKIYNIENTKRIKNALEYLMIKLGAKKELF